MAECLCLACLQRRADARAHALARADARADADANAHARALDRLQSPSRIISATENADADTNTRVPVRQAP